MRQATCKSSLLKLCLISFFLTVYHLSKLTFNDHCSHHIETSQLIGSANQLTSFYMMGTLVVKGLSGLGSTVLITYQPC